MNMLKKIATAVVIAAAGAGFSAPASAADGYNRWVRLVNDTDQTIYNVYADNIRHTNSTGDLLGVHVLEPGYSIMVNVDDDSGFCRYNLTAVYEYGYEGVDYDIDVCRVSEVRLRG